MKYEADAADLIRVGRAEGIEMGFSLVKNILELAREGNTVEYIATAINMPIAYVEKVLELGFVK